MNTQFAGNVWRVHAGANGEADDLFLNKNVVALGWSKVRDFREIEPNRDSFKKVFGEAYPDGPQGSIPVNAGQFFRFLYEIQIGDLVVYPSKIDHQVHIGIITGDYQYSKEFNPEFPHRRAIHWKMSRERDFFSNKALGEITTLLTLIQVKNYSSEFVLALDERLSTEFDRLFASFLTEYAQTPDGQRHIEAYRKGRETGIQNYQLILTADQNGEDITNLVLRKLLTHSDTKSNREAGAWIHIAPSVTSDIRVWFENVGWTKAEDWPKVARSILEFVKRCVDNPDTLDRASKEFVSLPYTRGLQTGMITPILNALNPEQFTLVNNKPRRVINYFTRSAFPQSLSGYSGLNEAIKKFVRENSVIQQNAEVLGVIPNDLFDMFSHWLVAVKKYFDENATSSEELDDQEDEIPTPLKLAEPFSQIFKDYDEALWALDVFLDALTRVGITDSKDKRFAITLPGDRYPKLRIILGNWILMSFIGRARNTFMQIALTTESAKRLEYESFEPFARGTEDSECRLYRRIPVEDFKSNKRLISAYEKSMPVIGGLFARWHQNRLHGNHIGQIAEAIFDPSKRERLLTHGLVRPESDKSEIYSRSDFTRNTGFSEVRLDQWLRAIERKRQAIIYGPPGTGKTFVAQEIGKLLTAGGDGFVRMVQFHPAYSYEDFIQGIRPLIRHDNTLGYEMTRGRFLTFCDEAATRSSTCVMIIDEINRANLSRVFGELMYLMEYRDESIELAGGEEFSIPTNVRILGTMNTADRSIALVDHALRRRFAFIELFPSFEILRQYHQKTGCNVEGLIRILEQLNRNIENSNYSLGISYFMREDLSIHIEDIWKTEIEPYLNEYFFDKPQRALQFSWANVKEKIAL